MANNSRSKWDRHFGVVLKILKPFWKTEGGKPMSQIPKILAAIGGNDKV